MRQSGDFAAEIEITPEVGRMIGCALPILDLDGVVEQLRDDDGELIFAGGAEHYFRNDREAHWYGRQVLRAFIRAMMDSPA